MEFISIKDGLPPAGHYTPAIRAGDFVFISGQLPIDPYTGEKCSGDIEDQTKRVLENISLILESVGARKDQVVNVVVYVSDIDLWNKVDSVYSSYFGEHKPTRCIVPTKPLHYGFNIEVEARVYLGK